ncbi:hypothetical protein [Stappia sp. MMSF_3263]|uniref:hypothetical protein n=1 Tax=Stappia sp. MMSF_3263 TaxID=3046693 RepID=UPI00273E15DF|nr:hypothetical protein [Stappia sp. MMSF_3263]
MSLSVFMIVNFLLATLMYLLLGRLVLRLLLGSQEDGIVQRAFARGTDPLAAAVRLVTPRRVPDTLLLLFAAVWLIVLRVALVVGFSAAGLLAGAGTGG